MEVGFSYGVLYPTLEEQANKIGMTLGKDADFLEKLRKSVNMCAFHVATDKQSSEMYKKLHMKVIKALKPVNETVK